MRRPTIGIGILTPHLVSGRIKRGITRHSVPELMQDAVHCGFITHGQLMGNFLGQFLGGGVLDDTRRKYMEGLIGGSQAGNNVGLSNDAT